MPYLDGIIIAINANTKDLGLRKDGLGRSQQFEPELLLCDLLDKENRLAWDALRRLFKIVLRATGDVK